MYAARDLEDLLNRLVAAVEGVGVRLDELYIYGSWAADRQDIHSDIDVALVSRDFVLDSMESWTNILLACRRVDPRVEPILYTPDSFRDEDPLAWQIKNTGKRIPLH